jgi:sulfonate transport system ATP-binding protein
MTMPTTTPLLDIAVDDKRYGERQVLRNLRLQLREGEQLSLIGASGCGKSTLLSIVAGLDPAYRGRVSLAGRALAGASGDIGFVFQEPRLFPWLTVAQNIAFAEGAKMNTSAGAGGDAAPRVAALLDEVGLEGYADALPRQLSGGQAQRVAIARGLFTQPRVLLLDEPFSAVDAFTRMKLQDLLARVARQRGLTLLLVTHDIDEALYLSERIVLLGDGGDGGAVRAQYAVDAAGAPAAGAPADSPRRRDDGRAVVLKRRILAELAAVHGIHGFPDQ